MALIDDALLGLRILALEFLAAALAERVERERRACDGILKMYDEAEAECGALERQVEDLQVERDRLRARVLELHDDLEALHAELGEPYQSATVSGLRRQRDELRAALAEAVAIARESRPPLPAPSGVAGGGCCAPAPPSFVFEAPLVPDPARVACAAAPMSLGYQVLQLDAAAPYRRAARLDELEALARKETP